MSAPSFQHTKRLDFRNLLSKKLGDESNSFRSEAELNGIINESLLTFGAIAQSWKDQVELILDSSKQFYDLTTDLFIGQNLLAFTLTYQFILDRLNFILFEEISEISPTSDLTSLDEILKFARNRINQYQLRTGLIISKQVVDLASPPINKVKIADEIIDPIRVGFIDSAVSNKTYKLRKEDEGSLSSNSNSSLNTTSAIPNFYTSALGTLNEISIYPPPLNLGKLEILSINGIPIASAIELTSIIPLPNNIIPYILFGVLADIFFKDGLGNDAARAEYCESRFEEGVVIGTNYTSILRASLNGNSIQLDSLANLDNNNYNWQNTIKKPSLIGLAGYNLLSPNGILNDSYSLLLNVITNAYLPTNDEDFIDIKLEYIETLLNYCIHLAMIKDGIAAIKQTDSTKQQFLKVAVSNNIRMLKRGQSIEALLTKTKRQQQAESVREEEEQAA